MKYTKIENKYYKVGEEINKTKLITELKQQIADIDITLQEFADKKERLELKLKELEKVK